MSATVTKSFDLNEIARFGRPLTYSLVTRDENDTVLHTETVQVPPPTNMFDGVKHEPFIEKDWFRALRLATPFSPEPQSLSAQVDKPKLPPIYVAVDLETTGLDSMKHGTIQIGAVASGAKSPDMIDYFVSYAFPSGVEYTDKAMEVNQISRADIALAPALSDVIVKFENWLSKLAEQGQVHLVFHNAPFDVDFLKRAGMVNSTHLRRVLDTVSLGFAVFGEVMSLKQLAETVGLPTDGRAHDAFYDANLTMRVFHELQARLDGGDVRTNYP